MKLTIVLIAIIITTRLAAAAGSIECDHPESSDKVRIYFANGVSNSMEDAYGSQDKVKSALGMQDKDFGLAYNASENWFKQLIQVYVQRENDSDNFWYWTRHMDQAPQWFRDEYVQKVRKFNEDMVSNDPDLPKHIRQYVADLVSGKKVVIVAHSQGNFYANNAYRFIRSEYSEYKDSIGIVSVANPSNYVEGGGSYALDDVYTTNPVDLIINLVRGVYPDTLPANVPPYDNPNSLIDHEFKETYFTPEPRGYRSRIIGQILQRIATLKTPEKKEECKNPEEIPVVVNTTNAINISATSASLQGYVQNGKQIAARCVWRMASNGAPNSCYSIRDSIATSGSLNAGANFACTATGLSPGTNYNYRVCGRQGDRISDGGSKPFRTGGVQCGQTASYSGGSEGLTVTYGMGTTSGNSSVEFEAYTIPDKLEIWQGSRMLYSTKECGVFGCSSGYVSNYHTANVYHNPYYGETWQIKVYGNANTDTKWVVKVSCPQ